MCEQIRLAQQRCRLAHPLPPPDLPPSPAGPLPLPLARPPPPPLRQQQQPQQLQPQQQQPQPVPQQQQQPQPLAAAAAPQERHIQQPQPLSGRARPAPRRAARRSAARPRRRPAPPLLPCAALAVVNAPALLSGRPAMLCLQEGAALPPAWGLPNRRALLALASCCLVTSTPSKRVPAMTPPGVAMHMQH